MSRQIGEHAVVLGASMAGLAAAWVLAEAYQRVTVLERDALPTAAAHRSQAAATAGAEAVPNASTPAGRR
jgi:glycine/D-amino acid oxidase-like deaminating enzyme